MGNPTEYDLGGLTLVTKNIKINATAPGQAGTDLSVTELSVLDGVTAGTATASKAVVLDASKNISSIGTVNTAAGSFIQENSVILPKYEFVTDLQNQVAAASYAVSHTIYVNDNLSGTYKIVAATATFGTASTSGTLQVEVATGTQAIGAGTNNLTGTLSLSGTANTPVNGTIIGSPTTIAAGNRINLIFAGTVTNLANAAVTIVLQRLT